ncbi:MAG: hypothetical protein AAGG75_06920 [Bacteroidota bacterium]
MSKKKFTDGLESLFGLALEDDLQESSPLLVDTRAEKSQKATEPKSKAKGKPKKRKRSSGKTFTSDLDSLFEAAVSDAIDARAKKQPEAAPRKGSPLKRLRRKPLSGIDALIRQTISDSRIDYDDSAPKKRVTFIYDKHKLARLKAIAKVEKAYLKDIIGKIVSEFIDEYEEKNGKIGS